MMFQIENTPDGYIVGVYRDLYWHRLRNFGDRQGDAIDFRNWDCPKLTDAQLRLLEKQFRIDVKYIRVSSTRFIKQTDN